MAWEADEGDLDSFFAAHGFTLENTKIITEKDTGRSRGFAFASVMDGEVCIEHMNGKFMQSRALTVREATERGPRA